MPLRSAMVRLKGAPLEIFAPYCHQKVGLVLRLVHFTLVLTYLLLNL